VSVTAAIQAIRDGRAVVVGDGVVGDRVVAADATTPATINFMAREARGVIGLALTGERCDALALAPMAGHAAAGPTVSIGARHGTGTGVSAADRARTIAVAIDPHSSPRDLLRPGHIFPQRVRPGGVLEHGGRAEAAVDLARLAGRTPAATLCTVLDDAGDIAGPEALNCYCARHGLVHTTVAAVVAHRRDVDRTLERVVATALPTLAGHFTAVGYRSRTDGRRHLALVKGAVEGRDVPVLLHVESLFGDVFHADGGGVDAKLAQLEAHGRGVLVYLSREDRGVRGWGHGALDAADHAIAAQMLADLGVRSAGEPAAVDVDDLAGDVARAG
jgi:3,4-dihydroxy 2-butanone 4-phosphate synthase/GTP cyclohydrolase II